MNIDPVAALREVAHLLERDSAESRRSQAFRRAADVVAGLATSDFERLSASGQWTSVPGLGPKTAGVVAQAIAGKVPDYLTGLRNAPSPLPDGQPLTSLLRGDLHTHTTWSDGGCPLAEMVAAGATLGREYMAVTDHSPRLRVARGLSAERLVEQGEVIHALNESGPGVRVLKGIEVDILADGSLDQSQTLLDGLDVVVASVHSELRMPFEPMTHRMVAAVANPAVDVLGHCTGRLIAGERGLRPQSVFDAEVVFEACRTFGVAVEINSRPERCDPPDDLLALANEIGCLFAIDTDSHATGQLEFLAYGAARAVQAGVDPDRIVTTWPLDRLLAWTRR